MILSVKDVDKLVNKPEESNPGWLLEDMIETTLGKL